MATLIYINIEIEQYKKPSVCEPILMVIRNVMRNIITPFVKVFHGEKVSDNRLQLF